MAQTITDLFMIAHATFSNCGKYRYGLTRCWSTHRPVAAFIGLNPSTADADHNDPTITRIIDFADSNGFGALFMLNLFAWRSTDPNGLRKALDPIGPGNDAAIMDCTADVFVAAWGNHGKYLDRGRQILEGLRDRGRIVKCFGLTKGGHPKHPLYLSKSTVLIPYPFQEEVCH